MPERNRFPAVLTKIPTGGSFEPITFNGRQDLVPNSSSFGALDTDASTQCVAFAENSRGEVRLEGGDGTRTGAVSHGGGKPGQGYPAVIIGGVDYENNAHGPNEPTGPLLKGSPSGGGRPLPAIANSFGVRRLTPRECERLQGFPDDHTLITYRGKPAADGPRYKAIGNSMAVPCMAWIGKRIKEVNERYT